MPVQVIEIPVEQLGIYGDGEGRDLLEPSVPARNFEKLNYSWDSDL